MVAGDSRCYVGLDLGWSTGPTGVASVDHDGRLLASGRVRTDDEIAAWVDEQPGRLGVVAVDAPLVVPNETGQRLPERLIGRAFGGFGASAHTSNRRRFAGDAPRAMRLAQRFGWAVDPAASSDGPAAVCIEVYPHPAMVGLFALPYRLDYKKGHGTRRQRGFTALLEHLRAIRQLALDEHPRWTELAETVADPRPGDLNRVEDELDAILCAHLAWLWHHERAALEVYGNLHEGYIVAPPPPSHRPARPVVTPAAATAPRERFARPHHKSAGDHR
jgi:predicted RNase H-like nuclease